MLSLMQVAAALKEFGSQQNLADDPEVSSAVQKTEENESREDSKGTAVDGVQNPNADVASSTANGVPAVEYVISTVADDTQIEKTDNPCKVYDTEGTNVDGPLEKDTNQELLNEYKFGGASVILDYIQDTDSLNGDSVDPVNDKRADDIVQELIFNDNLDKEEDGVQSNGQETSDESITEVTEEFVLAKDSQTFASFTAEIEDTKENLSEDDTEEKFYDSLKDPDSEIIDTTKIESESEKDTAEADMPEKQEEEALSPSLQKATCRYRWAKTVRTNAQDVVFFPSYKMEEPIKLMWDEDTECFFSPELDIPTGIYKGNLVIDGNTYPIEDVTIKHYTFEADIYIKEDIIEDEVGKSLTAEDEEVSETYSAKDVDTYHDINTNLAEYKKMDPSTNASIHLSSKYEELVKKQLSHSQDMSPTDGDGKELISSAGRQTPIGDVSVEPFQDGRGENGYLNRSFGSQGDGTQDHSFVEDEIERTPSRTPVKSPVSARQTPQKTVEEIIREVNNAANDNMDGKLFESEKYKSPLMSGENSVNGSHDNVVDDVIMQKDFRSPVGSPQHSLHSSARQTPVKAASPRSPHRSVEGSTHGSARHTPTAGIIDDMFGNSTLVDRSEHGHTPQSARDTPQLITDTLRTSGEKLYTGSVGSGSEGSRPQSLTSEQELTKYFEIGSRQGSVVGSDRPQSNRTPTALTSPVVRTSERTHSSSSLPVITTQQRLLAERTSMTPDNHIRVPGDKSASPLAVNPGTTRSNVSSRASDRTLTPGPKENGYLEDAQSQRINDLEDSVRNLRKLLTSREAEVHDLNNQLKQLKALNQTLTDELDVARMKQEGAHMTFSSTEELERQYNQILSEKEIMAGEIVKLQDQLELLQNGRNGQPDGGNSSEISHGISYNPNNPYALQRKISDLQSQVQDLQEANESAVAELSNTERKLEELQRENEMLRTARGVGNQDLQEENKRLHDQISKLYEKGYGGSILEDEHKVQIEVQQLRDDNRAVRERNYKLHEENIQLKDEIIRIRQDSTRSLPQRDVRSGHTRGFSLERSAEIGSERPTHERMLTPPVRSSLEREDARLLSSIERTADKTYHSGVNKDLSDRHRHSVEADRLRHTFESERRRQPVENDRLRHSTERKSDYRESDLNDGYFKNSIQKAETRIRTSLERADAKFRNSADAEDARHRYDDRYAKYSGSLDRNMNRKSYHMEDVTKLENYRSVPDGSIGDTETLATTIPLYGHSRQKGATDYGLSAKDRTRMSELSKYNTVGIDSEWNRYNKEKHIQGLCSEKESYKEQLRSSSTEPARESYPELSKSANFTERGREWSRSAENLRHTHFHDYRGRSRTPDFQVSGLRRRLPSPAFTEQQPSYYQTTSRFESPSYLRYDWEEEVPPPRPSSSLSERSNNTDYLTSSYTKPAPPVLSVYQPRDTYRSEFNTKGYDSMRKSGNYLDGDLGDESDTGTDILVNAKLQDVSPRLSPPNPELHRRHASHHYGYRRRRDSLGSEGSLSDDEVEKVHSRHPRSKSADGRELLRLSQPLSTDRSVLMTLPMDRTFHKRNPAPPTANLRTITPGVLTTQHNRNMLASSTGSLTSLTSGMKPFSPRSPGDINLDYIVKFSRQGGKLSQGSVKFVGHLPGRSDAYLGVELDKEDGKHDGKFEGMRYFRCKPNKGVFVAFNKVVMAWAPC